MVEGTKKNVEEPQKNVNEEPRLSNFDFDCPFPELPNFRMVGEQDTKENTTDMSSYYSTLGISYVMPKRENKESTDTNLPTPPEEKINKGGNIPPPIPPADRKDKYKRPEVENFSDALRELKYYIEEKSDFKDIIAPHKQILFKEALDIFPEWDMEGIYSHLSKLNGESEKGDKEKKGELIEKVGSMIVSPKILDKIEKMVFDLTEKHNQNVMKNRIKLEDVEECGYTTSEYVIS